MFRARPSWSSRVWLLTFFDQPDAPQGRCAPLPAIGEEIGAAVRQSLAHVVQQQVSVGEYNLPGHGGHRVLAGGVAWRVADRAAGFQEQTGAVANLRIVHVAHRRHREGLVVEGDFVQPVLGKFRGATVERGLAIGLPIRGSFPPGTTAT